MKRQWTRNVHYREGEGGIPHAGSAGMDPGRAVARTPCARAYLAATGTPV